MESERLFIALTLPAPVITALAAIVQSVPDVRWTPPEQLHLTLRFLGDVDPERRASIEERLSAVRVAPFILPVEGLGTFPPKRPPHIIWAGVGAGHPRLFQLRQRIDDALLATGLDLDVRTFHPHATLARCGEKAQRAVAHWLHACREFAAPPFLVESFDLFRSELQPAGAVHTRLRQFSLAE